MDHEDYVKFMIGCWTSFGITSVYTKEKIVRVTMDFELPKRHIQSSHCPLTSSNGFRGGGGKNNAMVEKGRDPW
jgi:hypothetical protein